MARLASPDLVKLAFGRAQGQAPDWRGRLAIAHRSRRPRLARSRRGLPSSMADGRSQKRSRAFEFTDRFRFLKTKNVAGCSL
ncbi:hypothetical protein NL676_025211 [Syzygium grande]|nr:hypothetical protein NL676_025211 [Syzygium grande]